MPRREIITVSTSLTDRDTVVPPLTERGTHYSDHSGLIDLDSSASLKPPTTWPTFFSNMLRNANVLVYLAGGQYAHVEHQIGKAGQHRYLTSARAGIDSKAESPIQVDLTRVTSTVAQRAVMPDFAAAIFFQLHQKDCGETPLRKPNLIYQGETDDIGHNLAIYKNHPGAATTLTAISSMNQTEHGSTSQFSFGVDTIDEAHALLGQRTTTEPWRLLKQGDTYIRLKYRHRPVDQPTQQYIGSLLATASAFRVLPPE